VGGTLKNGGLRQPSKKFGRKWRETGKERQDEAANDMQNLKSDLKFLERGNGLVGGKRKKVWNRMWGFRLLTLRDNCNKKVTRYTTHTKQEGEP